MRRSFSAVQTSLSSLDVQRRLSSPPIAVAASRETSPRRAIIIPGSCQHRRSIIRRRSRPGARFRVAPETPNRPVIRHAFFHCCIVRPGSYMKYGKLLCC